MDSELALALSGSQSWMNYSTNLLTVNGTVAATAATTLTVGGLGHAFIGGVLSDAAVTLALEKNGSGDLTINGATHSLSTTSSSHPGLSVNGGGTLYVGAGINDFGLKNSGRGGPAIHVGNTSAGNTLRNDGGLLRGHSLLIGEGTSDNNRAIFTRPGSADGNETLLLGGNGQTVRVGGSSSFNSLHIGNGAYVRCNGGSGTTFFEIGKNVGADNNSVTVTDAGSTLSNGGQRLFVGAAGSRNTLTVSAGGQVLIRVLHVGNGGSGNSATVAGAGSYLSAAECTFVGAIANGSDNSLVISGGASMFAKARYTSRDERALLLAGAAAANNNSITVTGADSLLTVGAVPSADFTMSIGLNNTRLGTESVSASNNSFSVYSGGAAVINNPLLVGGVNSAFNLGDGTGVSAAAVYSVSLLVEDARLSFNSGLLQALASGALISGPGAVKAIGPACISTAFDSQIATPIAGSGSLTKLDTGTLTLAETNTYSGATIVTNGTLRLTSDKCLSAQTAVWIWSPAGIDLAFTGTNRISALYIDGVLMDRGVYGAAELPAQLSGTGYLSIGTPGEELIIDNGDGLPWVQAQGAWTVSSGPGQWKTNYWHDGNTGKGTKAVKFAPNLPLAGQYAVFVWHRSSGNRASNVPVDIAGRDGTNTVTVNQKVNGSRWVPLGTFTFEAGTNGFVRIRNDGTDGYVMADAVRLVSLARPLPVLKRSPATLAASSLAGQNAASQNISVWSTGAGSAIYTVSDNVAWLSVTPSGGTMSAGGTNTHVVTYSTAALTGGVYTATIKIQGTNAANSPQTIGVTLTVTAPVARVVDNGDGAPWVQARGAWTVSSGTGQWKTNYWHDGNAGKGTKAVTFVPNLPEAGQYGVYIWYKSYTNRASNVPVDIVGSGETNTVLVNQKVNGSQWLSLGTGTFAAGTNGFVRIRNDGTVGYVIADAVRFVKMSSPAPTLEPASLSDAAEPPRSSAAALNSWPQVWASGTFSEQYPVANLTDGNTNTLWAGKAGGAPWSIGLDFGRTETLEDLSVLFADRAWQNAAIVGSEDGLRWYDVLGVTNASFDCRYILIDMWGDPARSDLPAIREIEWKNADLKN